MDDRLSPEKIFEIWMARDVQTEVDGALHMVIGDFMEGEAGLLARQQN